MALHAHTVTVYDSVFWIFFKRSSIKLASNGIITSFGGAEWLSVPVGYQINSTSSLNFKVYVYLDLHTSYRKIIIVLPYRSN